MNKLKEEGTFKIKRTGRKALDTVLIKAGPCEAPSSAHKMNHCVFILLDDPLLGYIAA